jgi:hypothetical protein
MIVSRFVSAFLLAGIIFSQTGFGQTNALPAPTTPPPTPDPQIIEDGGISIEPIFWLNRAQASLYSGHTATAFGDLSYPGDSKFAYGAELGIPAGRANTLRFSYFRVQGNGNSTIPAQGATIFSEAYAAGDYIAASYRVQNAKISWDYLSYTFKNHIRFKTLYEVQWVTVSMAASAPFVAVTTDASTGTTDTNSSNGSKNLFYPTLGGEFEQALNKHVRWEVKASGFGLPHHADIWDAQGDIAFRIRNVELLAGGKGYHFKTSPGTDQYFADTLQGAFVGLRYYWGSNQN